MLNWAAARRIPDRSSCLFFARIRFLMRHFQLLVLLFAGCLAPMRAQAPEKPAAVEEIKPDKEVELKLGQLKEIVADRKLARDGEGLDVITILVQKWQGGLNEKDKKDVVKGLESVFTKGKLRPSDSAQIYIGAAVALGQLGKDGAEPLQSVFEDKRFPKKEEWVPLRCELLKALGKAKDETRVKFLIEIARRDPEPQLEASAGEALGNFEDSKLELRKEIVSNLLIRYGEIDSRARQLDPADIEAQNMQKRLNVISGKWNATLRAMTGQAFHEYPEWNEWYNKNKSKEWK